MSISNQLLDIAQNISKIHEAGQLAILDDSEYMRPTVSGSAIGVNDVNDTEHSLGVSVKSKNIFDKSHLKSTNLNAVGGTTQYDGETITFTAGSNVNNSSRVQIVLPKAWFVVGERYTISLECSVLPNIVLGTSNKIGDTTSFNIFGTFTETKQATFTISNLDKEYVSVFVYVRGSELTAGDTVTINNIQIELGTTATEYTSYITDFNGVEVVKSGLNLWRGNTTDNPQFDRNGYINPDGTISTHTNRVFRIPIKDTLKYNISRNDGEKLGVIIRYEDKDKNFISVDTSGYEKLCHLYTPPKNASYLLFNVSETAGNLYCFSIAESANNNWEEPKMGQTVTANADGTVEGLTSLSPNMTLVSDTEGVVINLEYNVDTKMYIDNELAKIKAELSAAIVNS